MIIKKMLFILRETKEPHVEKYAYNAEWLAQDTWYKYADQHFLALQNIVDMTLLKMASPTRQHGFALGISMFPMPEFDGMIH